ncbi:MAG TPA: hypothetical protein VG838_06765 [Opitutaceae bacterium]|nr:hypothetical protein [Opitutaceae bacterium]
MKTQNRKSHLVLALVAGASLLISSPLLRAADEKMEHADMAKPATSAAALEQVNSLHTKIVAQVKAKELKSVHETAEQLTDVLNALPALSKDLPADKLKRVDGAVKNLAKALDALHDAADDNNQAGTEKQLGTVESLLKIVSAQYPAAKM